MIQAHRFRRVFLILAASVLPAGVPALANDPYPLEYFALREVVSNVAVSPDGKRVAMLRILSREGNPILHVYDASDMSKDPFVVDSDPMEIRSYEWVGDHDIVVVLRQRVRDRIEGQNQGVFEFRIGLLDVEEETYDTFDVENPAIENLLPNDPDKIIISAQPGGDQEVGFNEAYRPRAYYTFDLTKGTRSLLLRGREELAQVDFDPDGNPRFARGFDRGSKEFVGYMRDPGESDWREILRFSEDSFETFNIDGIDEAVPGNVIIEANHGNDKIGLWSYNTRTKAFDELIYRRSDVDVAGVRYHSNTWARPDSIVGVVYLKDKPYVEYFDEIEGATYAQLEKLLPHAWYTRITSRSRDGNTLTVANSGPHDPGTYYLLKDGRFAEVGSQQPLIDGDELADMEYITYEARDGRKIPAYVTIPHGDPPFPLIVLPHGGPFVQETVVYYEWSQMLANNGYMVIQPQYRGSRGYGLEHYQSAWIDGSEAGRKMQDDKDDGALYLVEQGLAERGRLAMFGWSYGGYAALVAASRTPQIYQCVIAGAAVADQIKQVNAFANMPWFRGAGKIEQLSTWRGAVSPVEEAKNVNVPMLIVHGSVDQRVQPVQARLYRKQLDKYHKPYRFVELEGADHFYDTLYYEHQIRLYESMIDFLKNECGPGGL
jgi:dipeptidyl aminopeptidase/acylaminoacyl peptidase